VAVLISAVFLTGCGGSCREPETLVEAGLARLRDGDHEAAAQLFRRAVEMDADNVTAHCNLGIALLEQDRPEDAVRSFKKAAELSGDVRPLELLGHAHTRLEQWAEARAALSGALKLAPDSARILTSLASVESRDGKTQRARVLLEKAVASDSSYAPAIYNLAVITEDPDVKARHFEQFLLVAGDDARAETAREFLASRAAETPVTEPEPPQAIERPAPVPVPPEPPEPSPPAVAVTPAEEPAPASQPEPVPVRAPATVTNVPPPEPGPPAAPPPAPPPTVPETPARERDPGTALQAWARGLAAQEEGALDDAARHYERALEMDNTLVSAWYNLGLVHKAKGELQPARNAFASALRHEPALTKARYMLAVVCRDLDENSTAIDLARSVVRGEPRYANAHFLLGLLYRENKERRLARMHFRRYLQLEPRGPSAAKARELLRSLK